MSSQRLRILNGLFSLQFVRSFLCEMPMLHEGCGPLLANGPLKASKQQRPRIRILLSDQQDAQTALTIALAINRAAMALPTMHNS